jgi:hypothetical protein
MGLNAALTMYPSSSSHPLGEGGWLATELDTDGDTLFSLADLDFSQARSTPPSP